MTNIYNGDLQTMSWNLLTVSFGNDKYKRGQSFLDELCDKSGLKHFAVGERTLHKSDIYKENKEWFAKENNYGHFAWKPYFILETMKKLPEGDKLLVIDTMDIFHPDIFKMVDGIMDEEDPCLLPLGNSNQGEYTKRDCFIYMDCDEVDYWTSNQLEAGFTFWRVCDRSKEICEEWLKWCLDERTNGDVTTFSGEEEIDGFKEVRHDQSILTNLALRDGLPVVGSEIRNLIECNADYWYERYLSNGVTVYRPVDRYMVEIQDECPYSGKSNTKHSLILTVHNKGWMIDKVIESIDEFTVGEYELIVVIDGCTDNSEEVIMNTLESTDIDYTIVHTPDVFETKANNAGIKKATGEYVIIIQDDMIIQESGWNRRMQKPFNKFDDVFAVTARTAHNYRANPNSVHLGMKEDLDNCWCDIVQCCDEADASNTPRNIFAVRATVNRGPLMINLKDLKKLNYLDEAYSPQDMDDHDLMFRAHKELDKVCGLYSINFKSDNDWGGTRVDGQPAPWLLKSHHKNSKIFYERNGDILEDRKVIASREV